MIDLFSSLVPVVSVLDPRVVFIHGKPFSDQKKITALLEEDCPQFLAILKKINCKLVFDAEDESVVAKGAAMMYLQKLFAVPELSEMESRAHFTWDDVIDQANRKRIYKKYPMGGSDE